jgi:hypothetical protein
LPVAVDILIEIDMRFKTFVSERKEHAERNSNKNND